MADNTSQVRTAEGSLAQGAKHVDTAQQTLLGEVSATRGVIESTQASWQGQGYQAFVNAANTWEKEATDVFNALQTLRDNLEGTQATFDQTEADVQAEIQRLLTARQN